MMIMNTNKMNAFELKNVVNKMIADNAITKFNMMKLFDTDEDLIDKFLKEENMSFIDMSELHLNFAVTIRNENGRLKNCKIIPCFIVYMGNHQFKAVPVPGELASRKYDANFNLKIFDDMFATRYGNCWFHLSKDNEFKFDDASTSNTVFFSLLEDAKNYLNTYTKWFHTKKKEDDDRKKDGIFTVAEIAEKLGIPVDNLKIVDDADTDHMYFDGVNRELYGELPDSDYIY